MVFTNPQLLHLHYHCNILSAIRRYLCYVGLNLCNILSLVLPIFTVIISSISSSIISRLHFGFHWCVKHTLHILLTIWFYDFPMSEIIDSRVERLPAIYDLEAFSVAVIGIHFATVYALLCIYGRRKSPRWACLALGVLKVLSEGTQVET
jgi:hypothetical protein